MNEKDPGEELALLKDSPDHEQLSEAVAHARLMLLHASEQGLDINPNLTRQIIKAKYLEKNNGWDEESETEFWQAFRDISQAIKPVNIDSIMASSDQIKSRSLFSAIFGRNKNNKVTLTRRAVQRYVKWALFALGAMLLIQIYSLIGTTILNNIKESNVEINKMEQEIILQQKLDNLQDARAMELNKDVVVDEREKNIELLALWLRPIDYLLLKKPADLSIFRKSISEKRNNKEVYEKINDLGIRVTQSSQHPILIIGSYILPLFYGLLGAYAYVLRGLYEEVKNITYSPDSDIKYILRITLGALTGLAVGLVFVPDSEALLTINLPPLTLAFVAGYSIEFLFTAIDKMIGGMKSPDIVSK